ncbi:hypothetical protein RKE29_07430 [Streptomyces sp. B1866]|uniref:hypothetical protein n=1 Tax=Streptomyces sp. B1866 TaxID=3075431 RepID=UPI0028919584|nr:hypothetical protein [Streptomyces sp. B1866]MDT3396473.1 hypothetical protein [Streptomyces sp. B1866]
MSGRVIAEFVVVSAGAVTLAVCAMHLLYVIVHGRFPAYDNLLDRRTTGLPRPVRPEPEREVARRGRGSADR